MACHATECAFDKDHDKRQLPMQSDTRFCAGSCADMHNNAREMPND